MFAIFFLLSSAFAAPAAPGNPAIAAHPGWPVTPTAPVASPASYNPAQVDLPGILQARRAMAELLEKVAISEEITLAGQRYGLLGYVGPTGMFLNLVSHNNVMGGVIVNSRGNIDVYGIVDAAILRLADKFEESDTCVSGPTFEPCMASEGTLVIDEGVTGAPIALDLSIQR